MTHPENVFDDLPKVFHYTRQQALAEGMLMDLTTEAQAMGFTLPVACTSAVWHRFIVPDPSLLPMGQSIAGRLHDLLWMLRSAIAQSLTHSSNLTFSAIFLMPGPKTVTARFKAICGPGDTDEAVITILLPHED